jgi:hypothetical protein
LLNNGALEKARVVARVQHCGIGERELAKILFGGEALLKRTGTTVDFSSSRKGIDSSARAAIWRA